MGFFDKAKQFLNIGGVKAKLQLKSPDISRVEGKVEGKLTLTTKSPQKIKSVKIYFEREIVTLKPGVLAGTMPDMNNSIRRGDTLGTYESNQEFEMKPGEEKVIDFVIQFSLPATTNEVLSTAGGVLGAIGGLGASLLDNRNTTYQVRAAADVDKAALDATDAVSVRLV